MAAWRGVAGDEALRMIEVRIYRDGWLIHEERCDTDLDAAEVVDEWCEYDGVVCEVDGW